VELSIMTIDCVPTRMQSTAGHLARSTQGGRWVRGEEPDEQPERFHMESLAVSKQEVVTAQPGTDWTAIQGSRCDLTVAACAGVLADRRGWRAAIRWRALYCVSLCAAQRAVRCSRGNRDALRPRLR
jgi:hypothetical protein